MKPSSVVHATTVVEHRFAIAPEKVFHAFADAKARAQWDRPGGDDWELAELEQDFRIGGEEHARFGPKGNAVYWSRGVFLDIVPNARIISAGTMHEGDKRISTTLCTIEFIPEGAGTKLVLTDQSAFLDGAETPGERKSGWGEIVERLALYLHAASSRH
jgi:uncharacterized protein YndB with AHSA1/START domain